MVITRDVTAEAKLTLADPSLVRQEAHTLWPAADGETTLTASFGGQSVTVPVRVARPPQLRRSPSGSTSCPSSCALAATWAPAMARPEARTASASPSSASTPPATTSASPARSPAQDQPGRAHRQRPARKIRRRCSAHRRQAARPGRRILRHPRELDRRKRSRRRHQQAPHRRRPRALPQVTPCSTAKARPSR